MASAPAAADPGRCRASSAAPPLAADTPRGPSKTDMPDHDLPRPTANDATDSSPIPDPDGYHRRLSAERRRKDDAFRRAGWSPVPSTRRTTFAGLAYFQPDVAYRFAGLRLEPIRPDEEGTFPIQTSADRPRIAYRLGRFRFAVAGRDLALTAYRVGSSGSQALFVPFRDATSGRETYGAGRYLDIGVEPDGTYVVDFNLAYNPYCAYSDSYSCPLPPAENWLPVRIEAGERTADHPAGSG